MNNDTDTTHPHITRRASRVHLIQTWGADMSAVDAARVSVRADLPPAPLSLRGDQARLIYEPRAQATNPADRRLLHYLIEHGHTSTLEHAGATFHIEAPLFVARQIMRHRTLSFNEMSRRYTSDGLQVWTPGAGDLRAQHARRLQCSTGEPIEDTDRAEELAARVEAHHASTLALYEELIAAGVAREVARAVLPVATLTRCWLSGNLLNLIKMIRLRTDEHAQPETAAVARVMRDALAPYFPATLTAAGLIEGEGGGAL